jgi:prolyl-tRNA editing enzyme YbaK/EbsC (Cys-tRNA(Pro) deacylase)
MDIFGFVIKKDVNFWWQDTEKCDTFSWQSRDQPSIDGLQPQKAGRSPMTGLNASRSRRAARREKVAHIRFAEHEISAVETAAEKAGLSVSAFVRSLSLEGAGIRPFLNREDRAILEMLIEDMRAVGGNLNQLARALNGNRRVAASDLATAVDDARAMAATVAAEMFAMTKRAGAARRGEAI